MMKRFETVCLPICLVFVAWTGLSCGYRPLTGSLPSGLRAMVIPSVQNHTAYSNLTAPLTAALRRKAMESGIQVEARGEKAGRLNVTVVAVNGEAGMLRAEGKNLVPIDKIWRIDVEAELVDADGAVLVQKQRFSASGRAFVVSDPVSEEALAAERRAAMMDDIADGIVSYMFLR